MNGKLPDLEVSFYDAIVAIYQQLAPPDRPWQIVPPLESDSMWIWAEPPGVDLPAQGWKLHISAGLATAHEVLQRSLPILFTASVPFKAIASWRRLGELNDGLYRLSQVGKFLTAYPANDAQAVSLADSLYQATVGLRGPAIPSDRAVAPGSIVHYRYGGFRPQNLPSAYSGSQSALARPDGTLEPDRRVAVFSPPDWVEDPFRQSGAAPAAESQRLIGDRFAIVSTISRSARGAVHLAFDLVNFQGCILKQADRDAQMQLDGRDARDRLRNEARILTLLAAKQRFPQPDALLEQEGNLFLPLEDIGGETLLEYRNQLALAGKFLPPEQLVGWARELAELVAMVHERGWVHRDLKPSNVAMASDGSLKLIDFDIAHELGASFPPLGIGTRGYMSPQQAQGETPTVTDDIYSFGALLYFLVAGVEPTNAPDSFRPLSRSLGLMSPTIIPVIAAVIEKCLGWHPHERYASMREIVDVLAPKLQTLLAFEPAKPAVPPLDRLQDYREIALELGRTLCQSAQVNAEENTAYWLSTYRGQQPVAGRNIYNGTAGIVLALAQLYAQTGEAEFRLRLLQGSQWLLTPPPADAVPGLYMGEAGVGAVLLETGQLLDRQDLIEAAVAGSRWVARQPHQLPELIAGTAGRVRFHLRLWAATGEPEPLEAAKAGGEWLLTQAEEFAPNRFRWRIPPGYEPLSDRAFTGYAHGAAGIADVLLELFVATGDDRYLQVVTGVANWLRELARPALDDDRGLRWPISDRQAGTHSFWCYGTPGIGLFFLRAARWGIVPDAGEIVNRTARTVAIAGRVGDATLCHGLPGNIEFLLDVYQATGDRDCLASAQLQGELLLGLSVRQDGQRLWASDTPTVFTPDYLVGYSGVAAAYLRLSQPESPPSFLSFRGRGAN